MPGITAWAKDLLLSRGALIESDEGSVLRALLPPEIGAAIGSGEWLSLRFGAGPGSDDETEWLDRLARLLPADPRVAGARLRHPKLAPRIDPAAVLERELVIQNGIFRAAEDYQSTARYYFFDFRYRIESDETSLGEWTACYNATAKSVAPRPHALLDAIREEIEDDPGFSIPTDEIAALFPHALRWAHSEIRALGSVIEQNANRRLARDSERIHSYYRDLLRQIEKRIARHADDPQAAGKERNRAAATELDRAAKLDDLARKYALKIHIQLDGVLSVSLPVREISARLIRKKAERAAKFHWNVALGRLEPPGCEGCSGPAQPLFLCDDRVHFLCKSCIAPCVHCGKPYCRACQRRCKCETRH